MFVEKGENDADLPGPFSENFFNSLFCAMWTITGAGTFTPKTWSGKIIVWSWSWLILLFVAAYTANLAAFLIIKPSATTNFIDLDDALASGASVCAWKGTPQE